MKFPNGLIMHWLLLFSVSFSTLFVSIELRHRNGVYCFCFCFLCLMLFTLRAVRMSLMPLLRFCYGLNKWLSHEIGTRIDLVTTFARPWATVSNDSLLFYSIICFLIYALLQRWKMCQMLPIVIIAQYEAWFIFNARHSDVACIFIDWSLYSSYFSHLLKSA